MIYNSYCVSGWTFLWGHCRLCDGLIMSTFFLFSFLHVLLTRIFFGSDHKLVFNYISECLLLCTGRSSPVRDS